jgi:hypothetical protein
MSITLTYLGQHWPHSGDLVYLTTRDGAQQARIYVDSLGETWVDIRRIPEGGYFHSERVEAFQAHNGARSAELYLRMQGFVEVRRAQYAHRVRERSV